MKQQFIQIEKRGSLERNEFNEFISYQDKVIWERLREEPIPLGELSGRIEKSFVTPKDSPVPDCLDCGVCCASVLCVQVSKTDSTPEEAFWEIKIKGKNREILVDKMMRRDSESGFCVALEGELGKSISCRIYENRPELCRLFDAGSDKCHALRRAYGIEPPLADFEIGNALMNLLQRDSKPEAEKIIYHAQILETDDADICEITVLLEDESQAKLHRYNVLKETWFENDFITLTLQEAKKLVSGQK